MKPVAKLNLNMNPAVCDEGSLVFAKNLKVDKDGCLITDCGYEDIDALRNYHIVGHVVGLDNKVYLFTDDNKYIYSPLKQASYSYLAQASYNSQTILDVLEPSENNETPENEVQSDTYVEYSFDINQSNYKGELDDIVKSNPGKNYYYLKLEGIDNIDDNFKLSQKGLTTTEYDTYFGFVLDYPDYKFKKYTNPLFVSYYITKLFTQVHQIFNNLYITKQDNFVVGHNQSNYTAKDDCLFLAGSTFADSLFHYSVIIKNVSTLPTSIELHRVLEDNIDITLCKATRYSFTKNIESIDDMSFETRFTYNLFNNILEYDEINKTIQPIPCNWHYSGGKIDGCVTTNVTGEKILSFSEYNVKNIPLKHINLAYCSYEDDESIYNQAPKIPIANLNLVDTYACTIPNGTYVFFIRYKIRKDVYTKWYLCSRPMFAGCSQTIETLQGGVKYINTHKDSAKSFHFNLSYVLDENRKLYKSFQLGFILSHDDSTNARIWKEFDMSVTKIYFDYTNIQEISIDELQRVTYELYDVNNITSFKNRLYISNYEESNFNPEDIIELTKSIYIGYGEIEPTITGQNIAKYGDLSLIQTNGIYTHVLLNGMNVPLSNFIKEGGINLTITSNGRTESNEKTVANALNFNGAWNARYNPDIFNIYYVNQDKLKGAKLFGNDSSVNPWGNTNFNQFRGIKGRNGFLDTSYWEENGLGEWFYQPESEHKHPFLKEGLSMAYGCVAQLDVLDPTKYGYIADFVKADVIPFNIYSLDYENRNYLSQKNCWMATDKGFDTAAQTYIKNNIEDEIPKLNKTIYAYTSFDDGTIYRFDYDRDYDTDGYIIDGENLGNGTVLDDVLTNNARKQLTRIFRTCLVGITSDGKPVVEINGVQHTIEKISFVYKHYELEKEYDNWNSITGEINGEWTYNLKTTDITIKCNLNFNAFNVISNATITIPQNNTLMPYSKYNVYIHYVDEYGVITNGVFNTQIETKFRDSNNEVRDLNDEASIITLGYQITLSSANAFSSSKYKAFFVSIENIGDVVVEAYYENANVENANSENNNKNSRIWHCVELDAMLYTITENITIMQHGVELTKDAKYYPSSSAESEAFGNCGFIKFDIDKNTTIDENIVYIIIPRVEASIENTKLIKASNYLPITIKPYESIYDGFYGAYLCKIIKPTYNFSKNYYVSGKDIYNVDRTTQPIQLTDEDITIPAQHTSSPKYVRSNFNLNYLALTEDINDQFFPTTIQVTETVGETQTVSNRKIQTVAKVINSATLSYIYTLPSMYRDFYNIYFRKVTDYYKTRFDNTVRVSNVLADESFNNSVFDFYPTEYYNIPTDRGIIVKLFSIANSIMVHTERSLYKFDANAILTTNETDIKLKESDPFDKGITQIFDSQYGYGGLSNKEAGCVTFDSYFFYDKVSKHIFGYGGSQHGIVTIDDTISKFIEYYKPEFCRIIHDEKNDRIMIDFVVEPKLGTKRNYDIVDTKTEEIIQSLHTNEITTDNYIHQNAMRLRDIDLHQEM